MSALLENFTVGIEEEFFLVDAASFDCVESMPEDFLHEARAALGDHVKREVIASMLEINSGIHANVPEALAEVAELRQTVSGIAHRHGLCLIAAGTHPFADWREQQLTPRKRYRAVASSLQALSKRVHVCGLHVHIGVIDDEARIDLMNRVQRFLPLLLALSTSSPFWRGEPTGLKGYRIASYEEIPRSGLPGWFANASEVDRYVAKLVAARFIPDASYLWWAIRPSSRFPTLELRISDSCTRVRDAGAIAALFQSLLHHLKCNPAVAREWEHHHRLINEENIWQAVRHGTDARFLDAVVGETTTVASWARDLISLVADSARQLGCLEQVLSVVDIVADGTSADVQLRDYEEAIADGASGREAACYVAEQLASRTVPATSQDKLYAAHHAASMVVM